MSEKILVNPRQAKSGEYLKVLDEFGRIIKFRPAGNPKIRSTHISRMIKSGDLVVVEFPKKKKKEE